MKSISVLSYESSPERKLTEIARHYQTSWATAVAHIGENMYLESDAEGNVTLLKRNESGVTEDDRRRLEVISSFRLGQMVNRIRAFKSPILENSVIVPAAFLGTVRILTPSQAFLLNQIVTPNTLCRSTDPSIYLPSWHQSSHLCSCSCSMRSWHS